MRVWRLLLRELRNNAGMLVGIGIAAAALDALVRSSLHALPPPLYQDPLVEGWSGDDSGRLPLLGVTVLDGRRRPLGPPQDHSSPSSASFTRKGHKSFIRSAKALENIAGMC